MLSTISDKTTAAAAAELTRRATRRGVDHRSPGNNDRTTGRLPTGSKSSYAAASAVLLAAAVRLNPSLLAAEDYHGGVVPLPTAVTNIIGKKSGAGAVPAVVPAARAPGDDAEVVTLDVRDHPPVYVYVDGGGGGKEFPSGARPVATAVAGSAWQQPTAPHARLFPLDGRAPFGYGYHQREGTTIDYLASSDHDDAIRYDWGGISGLDVNVEEVTCVDVTGMDTHVSWKEGDAIVGGAYGDGTNGKAMPTKAKLVDVLLPIQDVLKGAQVFEHVESFTTLAASKPNKLVEKDDADGFVVLRGHDGASEAISGDDRVISVTDHGVGESCQDAEATASCLDMLAMLGVVLIAVLLLSSGSAMPSSNPLLYKTTSSKTKTSKLGAWKLIVIALVSCHLIPLGSADTGNKVQDVDQHFDQFKLRGAFSTVAHALTDVYEEEDKNGVLLVSDAGQEEIKDNKLDPLRAHQEKRDRYAKSKAKQGLKKLKADFERLGLSGTPEEKLPSEDEAAEYFSAMYDHIHAQNQTTNNTATANATDAIMFIHQRTGNVNTSSFQEQQLCQLMFQDTLHLDENATTGLNFTSMDLMSVGLSCEEESFSAQLADLHYDPDHFCPAFSTLLPLRVELLPPEVKSDLEVLCSFLVEDLFMVAGEPPCMHQMEEIVLRNAKEAQAHIAFPHITSSPTFNATFMDVCVGNLPVESDSVLSCQEQLRGVRSIPFDNTTTTAEYTSNLCDRMNLTLPHPNETLALRFASPHIPDHKPGGRKLKIRHVISDIFNLAGHYKHGFMDRHGNYIEEQKHELLDPEQPGKEDINEVIDENNDIAGPSTVSFGVLPDVPITSEHNWAAGGTEKDIFCTGVAFSVGAGVSVSAGEMSIGGGIDQGFGLNTIDGDNRYESSTVWGLCGGGGESLLPDNPIPTPDDAPANAGSKMDVGISFEATAGFWSSVGALPGFAKVIEVNWQAWIFSGGVALVETFNDFWIGSTGYNGMTVSFGVTLPSGYDIGTAENLCIGNFIADTRETWRGVEPSQCSARTFSFDYTTVSRDCQNGMYRYYYETKEDYNNKSNRKWLNKGTDVSTNCNSCDQQQEHFDAKMVYAIGMVVFGSNGHTLASVSLFEHMGGTDWQNRITSPRGETFHVSRSQVCEWNKDGGSRCFAPPSGWLDQGYFKYKWTIDSWANVGNNAEQSGTTIKIYHDGVYKWSGHMGNLWSMGGRISGEYYAQGRFDTFRIYADRGSDRKDLFLVDWAKLETRDRWGNTCYAQHTWGGDNSVGYCLSFADPFSQKKDGIIAKVDIPMKHCYQKLIYRGIQMYRAHSTVYSYGGYWEPEFYLKHVSSGKYLDAYQTSNSNRAVWNPWSSSQNLKWKLYQVDHGNLFQVLHKPNMEYLDSWECNGCDACSRTAQNNDSQLWHIDIFDGENAFCQRSTIRGWTKYFLKKSGQRIGSQSVKAYVGNWQEKIQIRRA